MPEQAVQKLAVKQICYIDDSRTSAYVTKKILKQYGYIVDHFPDAESALDAFLEHEYSLVITDLMITTEGGVNGDDLIRLIRQSGHPVKSRIPIIVVTGSSDIKTHDNLIHVGANRVLPKPLDGSLLHKTIEELAPQLSEKSVDSVSERRRKPKTNFRSGIHFEDEPSEELKSLEEVTLQSKTSSKPTINKTKIEAQNRHSDDANEHLSADELMDFANSEFAQAESKFDEDEAQKTISEKPTTSDGKRSTPRKIELSPDIPILTETIDEELLNEELGSPQNTPEINAKHIESFQAPEIEKAEEIADSRPAEELTQPKQEEDSQHAEPQQTAQTDTRVIAQEMLVEEITKSNISPTKPETKPQEVSAKEETAKQTDFSKKSYAQDENNPLLALIDHLDDNTMEYNQSQPFKSESIFASKWFRRILWSVLIISLIVPAASFWYTNQRQIVVQTTVVSKGLLSSEISVPGRVVSKRKINISARSGGQIIKLAIREGDTVKKGQVLVQMDDKEARSNVKRTQAKLLSIQETVAQTGKMQERLQKALDVGAVSRQTVENAEAAWKTASAKQGVVEEELKAAELELERLSIVAPFDGMITSVTAQEGQWVAQSASLLNIVDMQQRLAALRVDVSDSGNLSIGQTVSITSDAFPGKSWQEKITKISSEAKREDSANIITVFATLDKSPKELRIGQQLDGQIQTAARSKALQVPFNVIFTHRGRPHAAVIDNSQVRFAPLVLGIESVSHVEVVEGLREGQQVIIPTGEPLEEGVSVVVESTAEIQ